MMGSPGGQVGSNPDNSGASGQASTSGKDKAGGQAGTTTKPGTGSSTPPVSGHNPITPSVTRNNPAVRPETGPTCRGMFKERKPLREKVEKTPEGERTRYLTPTGSVEKEVFKKTNGTEQTIHYASNGKVAREELLNKDGTREVTTHQFGRDGTPRAQETIHYDGQHNPVSKTVLVKNTTLNYVHRRYGYVYEPRYEVCRPHLTAWYNSYWYPNGVLVVHPFHYAWGWETHPWYRHYYGTYWTAYDVYPAPSYWVTDWLVAGYAADYYAASVSAAQAQSDAQLARAEATKAREATESANSQAEIAEARKALAQANFRAEQAEARAKQAERQETAFGKPNPSVAPIDAETKETLRAQIELTVAENKQRADEAASGGKPVPPDLSKALADPKHIYPVSTTISVTFAKDENPAGNLTQGDLLKLEPGQETTLKDATENTPITMRVISSKGEDGEVPAGSVVSLPLKSLQDFDSEFRAKLDLGLAEAAKNQDQFKNGTLVSSN